MPVSNGFVRMTFLLLLFAATLGSTTSCKSKKRLAREQAAKEYAMKVEQAKKDLNAMLNNETSWTPEQKQQRLDTIKSWQLEDEEVKRLIGLVEQKLAAERSEALRKAEEERLRKEEEERRRQSTNKYSVLENHFLSIAGAPSISAANERIAQAMQLFASPDVPVLIIISQAGGFNDYDRPTTIRRYLDWLKDQKVSPNRVEQAKYDNNGKITELELIKR